MYKKGNCWDNVLAKASCQRSEGELEILNDQSYSYGDMRPAHGIRANSRRDVVVIIDMAEHLPAD